jgi:fatty acyl-CoA reductase
LNIANDKRKWGILFHFHRKFSIFRLTRVQNSLFKNYDVVKFAVTNPIKFESKNSHTLVNAMSQRDQQEFNFDVRRINWKQYIENYYLGSRKYLWNQKPTDFIAGRRKVAK